MKSKEDIFSFFLNEKNLSEDISEEETEFIVKCKMRSRWVPHFLAMLKYMQILGSQGSSREVALYADGDGDFRPKFSWDPNLPDDGKPIKDNEGDRLYDAG